ncbi:hypothetical protein PGT21_020689 [Puccinia graminis f. sp. tritici]|uniref:Uncharacterized protein n=1 Tax=Puccinia graminis f. sp. tritici TaxID=56615 RepID=A0A5B0PGS7_PUCGR|nr:hypothetical protein PGT21_020689 [Puccinia graminis f. sp. tritici]
MGAATGERNPGSSSRFNQGIEHNDPDFTKTYSDSKDLTVILPVEHGSRPQKLIKLMGVLLKPQGDVTLEQEENTAHSNQPCKPNTLYENSGCLSEYKQDQQPIKASSNPGTTPIAAIPPTLEITKGVTSNDHFLTQRYYKNESESEGLKFDETIFILSPTSPRDNGDISKILKLIRLHLQADKLIMTEKQFIQFCMVLYFNHDTNGDADKKHTITNEERYYQKMSMLDKLLQNHDIWYQHWKKIANIHFEIFPENLGPKMRTMIVTYLLYVEMISMIVPVETMGYSVGAEVRRAFNLVENIYRPRKFTKELRETELYKKTHKIKKSVTNGRANSNVYIGLWALLEIWMQTYRPELFNSIIKEFYWEATKRFFNKIFFHSIENLTKQLENAH